MKELLAKILEADGPTLAKINLVLAGMDPDDTQLLTIEQARRRLSISRTSLWLLEKRGALAPVILPAGGKRYPLAQIKRLATPTAEVI